MLASTAAVEESVRHEPRGRNRYGPRWRTQVMPLDAEQFETRLVPHGVYLTAFDRREDAIVIEYESTSAGQTDGVPHDDIGRVINRYRDMAEASTRIEATVVDLEGDPIGTWYVEADWLDALADDRLSELQFSQRVLETIEHDVDESARLE